MKMLSAQITRLLRSCVIGVVAVAAVFCIGSSPQSLEGQQRSQGAYRISGTVVSAATGEPLNRANISLALPRDFSTVQSMQTGPDGHFAFDHLPAAKYSLTW